MRESPRFLSLVAGTLLLILFATGCTADRSDDSTEQNAGAETVDNEVAEEAGLVLASAAEYEFRAGSTFPSGWVNIRFHNEGEEPHFLLIWRLPEDRTFEDYAADVSGPFQELYTGYRSGALDQAEFFDRLTAALPPWFFEAVPVGGPGFTAAGETSETMVYLEPGDNYVIECYVRSEAEDHRFHGSEGMLRPLVVSDDASGREPPEADLDISVSNEGLEVNGDPSAGSTVVRVRVEDAPQGFIRHNVHLVRLEEDQSAADVAPWLDWVDEMLPPAPAEFLGGAGQSAPGSVSYVTFDLEPGRYAWVSEGRAGEEFLHEFSVE